MTRKIHITIIGALLAFSVLPATIACTDLRDLYDTTYRVLQVEGSWAHSLGQTEMQNATVMLFGEEGRSKEYFSRPNGATIRVTDGEYDVLVFNGIMESESVTNLDHIYFRGTDRPETFEVCDAKVAPLSRLSRTDDEYIASNEMELFSFGRTRISIEGDESLWIRYHDGKKTGERGEPVVAGSVETDTRAMSFRFQVRMTNIVNPTSARSGSGALKGFLGSVFVPGENEVPRTGFSATHHLPLLTPATNRTRTDEDGVIRGTLVSQRFVSFGPPLSNRGDGGAQAGNGAGTRAGTGAGAGDGDGARAGAQAGNETGAGKQFAEDKYFFEPVFVLTDGTEYTPGAIDVTAQVKRIAERLTEHFCGREEILYEDNFFEITIDDKVVLPIALGGGGGPPVGVEPWPDDEIIIVWI